MSDRITIDELKVFVGTGLEISYQGQKVVGEEKIDGFLGPVMAAKLEDADKVGKIVYLKFTKASTWVGIGQSLYNCKNFYVGDGFKPIVRPWSHLTKEIEVDGERFVPLDQMTDLSLHDPMIDWEFVIERFIKTVVNGKAGMKRCLELASWNFDIFGWLNRTGEDGKPLAVEMGAKND